MFTFTATALRALFTIVSSFLVLLGQQTNTAAKDHVLAASSLLRFSGIIQLKLHIASSLKHRQKFPKCQNNSSNTSEFPHNNNDDDEFSFLFFVFSHVMEQSSAVYIQAQTTTTTTIIKSSCHPEIRLKFKASHEH
jgi:hypothetical protein